jgi:hypothetical protein
VGLNFLTAGRTALTEVPGAAAIPRAAERARPRIVGTPYLLDPLLTVSPTPLNPPLLLRPRHRPLRRFAVLRQGSASLGRALLEPLPGPAAGCYPLLGLSTAPGNLPTFLAAPRFLTNLRTSLFRSTERALPACVAKLARRLVATVPRPVAG